MADTATRHSSGLAAQSLGLQVPLVEALAKSSDIVTFIASAYGHPFRPNHFEGNPPLEGMSKMMGAGPNRATELGVAMTVVSAGLFDEYFFGYS